MKKNYKKKTKGKNAKTRARQFSLAGLLLILIFGLAIAMALVSKQQDLRSDASSGTGCSEYDQGDCDKDSSCKWVTGNAKDCKNLGKTSCEDKEKKGLGCKAHYETYIKIGSDPKNETKFTHCTGEYQTGRCVRKSNSPTNPPGNDGNPPATEPTNPPGGGGGNNKPKPTATPKPEPYTILNIQTSLNHTKKTVYVTAGVTNNTDEWPLRVDFYRRTWSDSSLGPWVKIGSDTTPNLQGLYSVEPAWSSFNESIRNYQFTANVIFSKQKSCTGNSLYTGSYFELCKGDAREKILGIPSVNPSTATTTPTPSPTIPPIDLSRPAPKATLQPSINNSF